jgi:plastocyanin
MDRRGSGRVGTLVVLAMLVATACGGSEPPDPGGGSRDEGVSPQASAPSAIDGDYFSGASVIRLDAGAWTYVSGGLRWTGIAEIGDGELALSGEQSCPDRATYTWTAEGQTLTLAVVDDPCPGRQVLLGKAWEAIPALDEDTPKATVVTLPDLRFAAYWGTLNVSRETEATIEVAIREGYQTGGWAFSPTILAGEAGQALKLTISNPTGKGIFTTQHNFTLEEQGISVDIEPGEEATVSVTFPESGSLTFFCRRHVDEGQAGALVVA